MQKLFVQTLILACMIAATAAAALTTQPLQSIRDAATDYVRAQQISGDTNVRISAKRLDPRLKLPLCDRKLQAFMPYANVNAGNTTVGVRCEGKQPWSLYVPVSIQIFRKVAVASRPLAAGKRLQAKDIRMQRMEIGRLAGGYVTEATSATGRVLTRPVQIGQALTSNILKAPTIIHRGQIITMLARQAAFEVRTLGKALSDGAVGQRIRVRNGRSKRIIEGVIGKNGMVLVN